MAGNNNGDVIYEVRADHSKVESDINQANAKVEKAVKKSADETVRTEEKKTKQIREESDKVVKNTKKAADDVADAWKDSSKKIVDSAEDTGKKMQDALGDGNTAVGNIGDVLKSSFSDAAEGAVPFIGQVGELTKGLSGAQAAAIGVGAAAVGVGALAVGAADDMKSAMNDFLAITGKSKEETERYQAVLENIYANNYGDSFSDIANSMAQVTQTLGDMDDESLQRITESAYALQDTFEYGIGESTRSAKALMDNFGLSGEEAMNLIAAGAQNGLDYSGELLDSINEYSVQFAKVGLDADDMFKIFQKGADSGAFNLDKVGDAIKEMSIRVIDGSDTTKEGFKAVGLDADKMSAKFAAGGESAKEAFYETVKGLASIKDPLEQNTAGVNLFGTMWEDLGPEVVTALADIEDGAYDTGDALGEIKDIKYDDLGSMLEELKRNVELLLIPIGEALIPLLSILIDAVLPVVQELLAPIVDLFAALIVPIIGLISTAITPLIDVFLLLMDLAIKPLIWLVENLLVPIFTGGIEGMASDAERIIGNIKKIFENIIDFIKNIFTGNWEGAWENVKNIFSAIVESLGTIWKSPINFIIDGINKFITGLNNIKIPDWVPDIGGKGLNISKIPRLKVGMDYVPSDFFPAFLDEGEAVLTKEENAIFRSLGGLEGMAALLDSGKRESEVVVHNTNNFDYGLFGEEVYAAFKKHGMSVTINHRELGRIIEDILKERG